MERTRTHNLAVGSVCKLRAETLPTQPLRYLCASFDTCYEYKLDTTDVLCLYHLAKQNRYNVVSTWERQQRKTREHRNQLQKSLLHHKLCCTTVNHRNQDCSIVVYRSYDCKVPGRCCFLSNTTTMPPLVHVRIGFTSRADAVCCMYCKIVEVICYMAAVVWHRFEFSVASYFLVLGTISPKMKSVICWWY